MFAGKKDIYVDCLMIRCKKEKDARLEYCLVSNHPFVDGNKFYW